MRVFDTSAWIECFSGSLENEQKIRKLLEDDNETYTSAISLAEVSKWAIQNNLDVEKYILAIKRNSIIIDLKEQLLIESGKNIVSLRKLNNKISLIDSIIYTTALLYDLVLITKDWDFKDLKNVEII